ncbi:hypothetical protein [Acidovorax sp. NCPPB 3576]|uniref:hypothetical protein n=1 Tax=Acidovorax sp. NCPPB 3576 TaxID=2940488 RepID=UPI00234AB4DA|nr:hypothetical protein [Acidovorax sp. NCPPB 3576]WCM88824.1 hypothetical protein M5C98_01855 [Acidovorax sp. NCPPB 3576]
MSMHLLEALVVPAGSTVILRTAQPLSDAARAKLAAHLSAEEARTGTKFLVFADAHWEAMVIGAPE